jgi:hypothetical protein
MTTALEHRLAELDREIAAARPEYDRTRVKIGTATYVERILLDVARIAELLDPVFSGDRPDLQGLMVIGAIHEIVRPYTADSAVIDRYERLRSQRQRFVEQKP